VIPVPAPEGEESAAATATPVPTAPATSQRRKPRSRPSWGGADGVGSGARDPDGRRAGVFGRRAGPGAGRGRTGRAVVCGLPAPTDCPALCMSP
jgi:hypothetical protein